MWLEGRILVSDRRRGGARGDLGGFRRGFPVKKLGRRRCRCGVTVDSGEAP